MRDREEEKDFNTIGTLEELLAAYDKCIKLQKGLTIDSNNFTESEVHRMISFINEPEQPYYQKMMITDILDNLFDLDIKPYSVKKYLGLEDQKDLIGYKIGDELRLEDRITLELPLSFHSRLDNDLEQLEWLKKGSKILYKGRL